MTSFIGRVRSTKGRAGLPIHLVSILRRLNRPSELLLFGYNHTEVRADPVLLQEVVLQGDQARQDAGRVAAQSLHVEAGENEPQDIAAVGAVLQNLEQPRRLRMDCARANGLERVVERQWNHQLRTILDFL